MVRTVAVLTVVMLLMMMQPLPAEADGSPSRVFSLTRTMPQLDREKWIWIYLPPGYGADENRRYPVIYMQDGQYLFDPSLSADNPYIDESLNRRLRKRLDWFGNWKINKRLDRLVAKHETRGFIVVGISSEGSDRTSEYSPWVWYGTSTPEADHYAEFIVETLKPYIDEHYLTLGGRADTAIAGSSMGGLLALYAGLRYQEVFSKIAAFSPVLNRRVWGRKLIDYIRQRGKSHDMSIYVDLGSREPGFGPLEPIYETLRGIGFPDAQLRFRQVPGGEHRIADWGERFPEALLWLFR